MDYGKNYMNTVGLADRIRESAAAGKKEKAAGGLGAREERRVAREQQDVDFGSIRAGYLNDIRDIFTSIPRDQAASEIQSYLDVPTSSPFPERNPEYWEGEPLLASISTEVTDENVRRILDTIKGRESGGDYRVQNAKGSASGGYQFIDSTWQGLTKKYGIGTNYSSAKDAPPEVQDVVAAAYVKDILAQNNNDITKVPVVWYTGNAAGEMSAEALAVNDGLTAAEYQNKWMRAYGKNTGATE